MEKIKRSFLEDFHVKCNSGEIEPINNTTFKKFTIEHFTEVLKELNKKINKSKSIDFVINSQISDELYSWEVVKKK